LKTCTVCEEAKPYSEYYNYKASKDGKMYRCKFCDSLARKKYAENNKESAQRSQRGRNLKHKYGISLEDYETLFEAQGRCCAICETKENKAMYGPNKSLNFSVDHCHATNKVRGILCNQCNRAIGMLGDTPESLYKAYAYLKLQETH